MPTYEYECQGCGHVFEEFQSITARPLKVCPKCRKARLRRLIGTGAGLLFKGSGFYATDYRSSDYKAKAKADTSAPSPAPPASCDSKPCRANCPKAKKE